MKKLLWGIVLCLAIPLMGQFKEITDKEGNVYQVYIPQVIRPVLTLPEVIKLSVVEIQALSPDVITATIQKLSPAEISIIQPIKLVYMVSRLTAQELRTIEPAKLKVMITRPSTVELQMLQPETVAIVITQLQERDLDEVLKKIAPRGYWYVEQVKFFEAWKAKDISAIASMVAKTRVEQPENILAFSNYQNFDQINWNRNEFGFNHRQVLVSSIDYDYKDKFKPQDKIILTIDFGLNSKEIQALSDIISTHKDKITMVINLWGNSKMNNFENRDISTYPEVAEYANRIYYLVKEIDPTIPVYLTVCYTSLTMDAWVNAGFERDGIALWNILTLRGPLRRIYNDVSKYNENVILSGVMGNNPDTHGWRNWEEVKAETLQYQQKVKEAGFGGLILMGAWRD